jgi:hypothetical protein
MTNADPEGHGGVVRNSAHVPMACVSRFRRRSSTEPRSTVSRRKGKFGERTKILRQFLHADPVAASCLFGCGGRSAGAVVDPVGEVGPYIAAAEATGMRIL